MGYIKGFMDKYPEKLYENRTNIEGAVIGLLTKDLLLIDDVNLNTSHFKTSEGKLFFRILSDLRKQGCSIVDEVTLISNISTDLQEKLEDNGGYQTLKSLSEIIDERNSDSIIDTLHRENYLLRLYDKGYSMLKPQKDDFGKEFIPIDLFRKMRTEDVIAYYEAELSSDAIGYGTKILFEGSLEMTNQYKNSIMNGESNGIPFDRCSIDVNGNEETVFPYLSNGIKGFVRGRVNILAAYSSVGKTAYWTGIYLSLIEQGEKIIIFSNEQDKSAFLDNIAVWISYKHFRYYNISKSKIKSGNLSKEELKMLDEIQKYYNDNYADPIYFIDLPSMDIETIKKKTKDLVLKNGFSIILIDTLKMDYSKGVDSASRHNLMIQLSEIHAMCRRYDLIGLLSFQLAPSTLGKLFLDVTCLSEAKALKDLCENLFMMRIVYPQELVKGDKLFFKPFQRKLIDGKWKEVPYETDPKKIYRVLFSDKCRCGQNSGDSGIAQLLEFDALHSVFKEVAFCRPKRGIIS